MKLRGIVTKVSARISPVVTTAWALLLLTMTVHVVGNGLLRKFFRAPIEGTNEITQYWYMPLIAFGGFIITEMRNEHIEARIIFDKMPLRVQREFQVGASVLVVAVCAAFAVFTGLEAFESLRIGLTGGVINLTIWPVTFAAPVSFGAMAVIGAGRLVEQLRELLNPGHARHDERVVEDSEASDQGGVE